MIFCCRSAVPKLKKHISELDYQLEDDGTTLAEGVDDESLLMSNNMRYCWIAYRVASKTHFHLFSQREAQRQLLLKSKKNESADSHEASSASSLPPLIVDTPTHLAASTTLMNELLQSWRCERQLSKITEEQGSANNGNSTTTDGITLGPETSEYATNVSSIESDVVLKEASSSNSGVNIYRIYYYWRVS